MLLTKHSSVTVILFYIISVLQKSVDENDDNKPVSLSQNLSIRVQTHVLRTE